MPQVVIAASCLKWSQREGTEVKGRLEKTFKIFESNC